MADETGNKQQKQVLFWLSFAVLLALAILALQKILLPFVAGVVLAYALNPVADGIERIGIGRTLASLVLVLFLVIVFVLAVVFLVPILVDQARQIAAALPGDLQEIRPKLQEWVHQKFGPRVDVLSGFVDAAIRQFSDNWTGLAGTLAKRIWDQGWALIDFLSILFITPIVVFYLLVDWPVMLRRLTEWLPREHEHTILRVVGQMDQAISAFIRGQGLICLVLGTLYTVGLSLIGLPYGILIGIVTGVLTFIPVVGTVVGLVTASLVALLHGGGELMIVLKVVGIFALGQAIDSGFLSPRIVGPKAGLHPVGLIFSLFVFSYLFGFVGVLVAVPMAAAVAVLIRFALELYLGSKIYKGHNTDQPSQPPGGPV
jgi:predicted PurR-regulated permease PerM